MTIRTYTGSPNCNDSSYCGSSLNLEFDGFIPGFAAHYRASGSITSSSTGVCTVTIGSCVTVGTGPGGTDTEIGGRITTEEHGLIRHWGDGDVFTLAVGTIIGVGLEVCCWLGVASGCLTAGGIPEIRDSWDEEDTADIITCLLTSFDHSNRDGGPLPPLCLEGPGPCYGGGVEFVGNNVTRSWNGVGCVQTGINSSERYTGSIDEAVDLPDGDDTAIQRAVDQIPDWIGGACATTTAYKSLRGAGEFSLAFRIVRVKVTVGSSSKPLSPGNVYEVTVKYVRRALGSGGPFTAYAEESITLVATLPVETTGWLTVPNGDEGYETKASGCSVKDITLIPPPPGSPNFTSPLAVPAASGSPFAYQITAGGSPTAFGVTTSLPPWLHYDSATHTLTGTPRTSPVPDIGTWLVGISATNSHGTNTQYLAINVPPP